MIFVYALFYLIDPTRKALKDGVIPSLDLPKKSISVPSHSTKETASFKVRENSLGIHPPTIGTNTGYKSLTKFQQCISKLKVGNSCERDRFSEIQRNIHFCDPNLLLDQHDRLCTIRPIIEHLQEKIQRTSCLVARHISG